MKYFIFLFLLVGCETNVPTKSTTIVIRNVDFEIYEIKGCQYLGHIKGANSDVLTHKGNCKNPIHYENTQNKESR